MINPKLKKGDRVVLLHMDGEMSIPPGTLGTVKSHSVVFGDDQYSVEWDNGSRLSIISSVDLWDLEDNIKKKPKKIKEADEVLKASEKNYVCKNMKLEKELLETREKLDNLEYLYHQLKITYYNLLDNNKNKH